MCRPVGTYSTLNHAIITFCLCSELLGTAERWHWLLGFNGFTALLQLSTLPFLPESPSFLLLERGDEQACDNGVRKYSQLFLYSSFWCDVLCSSIPAAFLFSLSFKDVMGQQKPQQGDRGDAEGEGCPRERPQRLTD